MGSLFHQPAISFLIYRISIAQRKKCSWARQSPTPSLANICSQAQLTAGTPTGQVTGIFLRQAAVSKGCGTSWKPVRSHPVPRVPKDETSKWERFGQITEEIPPAPRLQGKLSWQKAKTLCTGTERHSFAQANSQMKRQTDLPARKRPQPVALSSLGPGDAVGWQLRGGGRVGASGAGEG